MPNDSLGAEKIIHFRIRPKSQTKHFTGSIVVYRTQLTDLIDITRSKYQGQAFINGQPVYRKTNIAQAFVQGVEAEVEVPVSRAIALEEVLPYHG
ncbi:MAG: hypothetical protein R3B93_24305 [Bacteroidia bacterium]